MNGSRRRRRTRTRTTKIKIRIKITSRRQMRAAKAWTRAVRAIISAAMKKKAYARAGVDIDLGNRVKATLPQLLRATHRPEVLGKVGGFGGLFAFNARKFKEPVLVSSVDG